MVEWVFYYELETGKYLDRFHLGGSIPGDVEEYVLVLAERFGLDEDAIGYRFETDAHLGRLRPYVVFYEMVTNRELLAEEVLDDDGSKRIEDLLALVAIDNDLRTNYVGKRFELR